MIRPPSLHSSEANYGLVRLGVVLLAFASTLLGNNPPPGQPSPMLAAYLGFALLALLFAATRSDSDRRRLLVGTLIDAGFIGAILSTHAALPLLAATPLLTAAAAWCVARAEHTVVIGFHGLALSIAWSASGWHLTPGLQLAAAVYLVAATLYAFWLGSSHRQASTSAPTSSGQPHTQNAAIDTPLLHAELLYDTQAVQPPQCSAISQQRLQVLFGNSSDSAQLKSLLHDWGAHIESTKDSAGLLAQTFRALEERGEQPDAIIIDARGRGEDPEQLLKLCQHSPQLAGLRYILITNSEDPSEIKRLRGTGFAAVLQSPLDKTLLFNALHPQPADTQTQGVSSLLDRYLRAKSPLPPLDILLAVQNQIQLKVIRRLLERNGHNVYTTSSGEPTLDAMTAHRFDVAMLDLDLPEMDGIEITRIYRLTHPKPTATPIVILSNQFSVELQRSCEHAGAEAVLGLPLQPEQLNAALGMVTGLGEDEHSAPGLWLGKPVFSGAQENMEELDRHTLQELEQLGNGLGFVQELVEHFINDSNEMLRDMQYAAEMQDLEAFRDCAHALKGSAGSVGAIRLQQFCISMTQLRFGDLRHDSANSLDKLRSTLLSAHDALLSYLNERREQAKRS